MERTGSPSASVVICTPVRGVLEPETLQAIRDNISIPFRHLIVRGKGVVKARNELVRQVLALSPRPEYVVWLDADQWFCPGQIEQMIRRLAMLPANSLLGCIVGPREPHKRPFQTREIPGSQSLGSPLLRGIDYPKQQLLRVHKTGFALVAHRTSLLEIVGKDPFTLDAEKTEDFEFVRRVREAGGAIVVDCALLSPHVENGFAFVPEAPPYRIIGNRLIEAHDWRPGPLKGFRSYGKAIDANVAGLAAEWEGFDLSTPLLIENGRNLLPGAFAELDRALPSLRRAIAAGQLEIA
jgi:hypothetical protein